MKSMVRISLVLAVFALSLAWMPPHALAQEHVVTSHDESPDEKAQWIEKVARSLRAGHGISLDEDMDELLAMPREQIVDKFINDPRFGDTVLAFNLYFLGRSLNDLRSPGWPFDLRQEVLQAPQAVAAAQTVLMGGDYWILFDEKIPLFTTPLRDPYLALPSDTSSDSGTITPLPGTEPTRLTPEQRRLVRSRFEQEILTKIDRQEMLLREALANPQLGLSACSLARTFRDFLFGKLQQYGFGKEFTNPFLRSGWLPKMDLYISEDSTYSYCVEVAEFGEQLQKLRLLKSEIGKVFAFAATLPENPTPAHSIGELLPVHLPPGRLPDIALSYPTAEAFWQRLVNTSTNYNRKRAAYVLKTYFCDDLTPIAVASGENTHTEGRHASEPGCQSCHYKLDPLAGLFRYYGAGGKDFKNSDSMVFDDNATFDRDRTWEYLGSWRNSPRHFNVGYYTAPNTPHRLWEGQELSDLWTFMRRAPEVKQCLTKRLAEYVFGPEQSVDGAWLSEVARNLNPGAGSGQAFKEVVRKLALSNTFAQLDPTPGECYDFVAGSDPMTRPPCAIASLVESYCSHCHGQEGHGLNVKKWVQTSDGGNAFDFVENGEQLPSHLVFSRLLERLTTSDRDKRMPRGGAMSDADRQIIFKWLTERTQLSEVQHVRN